MTKMKVNLCFWNNVIITFLNSTSSRRLCFHPFVCWLVCLLFDCQQDNAKTAELNSTKFLTWTKNETIKLWCRFGPRGGSRNLSLFFNTVRLVKMSTNNTQTIFKGIMHGSLWKKSGIFRGLIWVCTIWRGLTEFS